MYIHIYIHIYVYIHTYIYTYIYIHFLICISICMHIHTCLHIHRPHGSTYAATPTHTKQNVKTSFPCAPFSAFQRTPTAYTPLPPTTRPWQRQECCSPRFWRARRCSRATKFVGRSVARWCQVCERKSKRESVCLCVFVCVCVCFCVF